MTTAAIDMTTTEGIAAHFATLPTSNLKTIEARPVWNADSALMAVAAAVEIVHREGGGIKTYTLGAWDGEA
jgi:hypothetical protein